MLPTGGNGFLKRSSSFGVICRHLCKTFGELESMSFCPLPSTSSGIHGEQKRHKHPPHLRGKAIGRYYAQRAKAKAPKEARWHRNVVMIDSKQEQKINDILQKVNKSGLSSSASPAASSAPSANDSGSSCSVTAPPHPLESGAKDASSAQFKSYKSYADDILTAENLSLEYRDYVLACWLKENGRGIPSRATVNLCSSPELNRRMLDQKRYREKSSIYDSIFEFRSQLPAYKMRREVIEAINRNQVIVISGETGCGKTTQVPQFILDDYVNRGRGSECRIICTQPRRISAIAVAERVAYERLEVCGGDSSIGYQIRLEDKLPRKQGSILYCTTGIVLQHLHSDPYLSQTSHIILDEIHERDLLSDFLMIILKDLLSIRQDLKVILMSATLSAKQFSKYFGNGSMIINIPGFTYPVQEYYLEDVLELTGYSPDESKPRNLNGRKRKKQAWEFDKMIGPYIKSISDRYSRKTLDVLQNWDESDESYDLIIKLLKHICQHSNEGAILIFQPGWNQICELSKLLSSDVMFNNRRYLIIPLHSLMPTVNQREVFDCPPPGVRKIIIATNIAETSITINDVVFVIDSGKIKISNYDAKTNVATLEPEWVSLANARQRRGRAGRTRPGVCYHLYTKVRETKLPEQQLPEMLRTRIENICLKIKILKLGKIEPFVAKALDPPQSSAVAQSIKFLKTLGALNANEELTPLGFHLAQLPMEPQMGKMILLASIFSCLDPVLSIAAILSFKEPFVIPMGKERGVDNIRKSLAGGTQSDHLMYARLFKKWEDAVKHGFDHQFCWKHFVSMSTMRMLRNMKQQFARYLCELKFLHCDDVKHQDFNVNSKNEKLVKAIVCAGLYPNVAEIRYRQNKTHRPPDMRIPGHKKIRPHPKSVNHQETQFLSNWLVYYEKIKTTNILLHDTSVVNTFPLLFFGGDLTSGLDNGMDVVTIDEWITFSCPPKTTLLVKQLRAELDKILEKRIRNPGQANWDPNSPEGYVLREIVSLITSEEMLRVNQTTAPDLDPSIDDASEEQNLD